MDSTERQFFTDTATASLSYAGEGDIKVTNDDGGIEDVTDDLDTTTIDSPWAEFFGTDEFVQFEATVAQPIVQPYVHDGQLAKFRKDEDELKRAQAQLDNLPWTKGHPPHKRVRSATQIEGFWSDPYYEDGQQATLNVPANNEEALEYAITNDDVSVGFSGELDWVEDDEVEYDATQRNMAYDHVASVEQGRCSSEQGCGLHTDSAGINANEDGADGDTLGYVNPDTEHTEVHAHGHVFSDNVRSGQTEEPDGFDEGDWVAWTDSSGDRRHGQLSMVSGNRAIVREYDTEVSEFTDENITVATSSLSEWVGPQADECPGPCSCGLHDGPFADNAPEGIYVEDGSWFGVAPAENPDDEPKFDLNNCNDVKDAFNLRNNGDIDIATDTLVNRIQRAADFHDCPDSQRPWTDADNTTGVQPDDQTDTDTDTTTHMSDDKTLSEFIDEQNLTAEDVIDALDVEVPTEPTAHYDGEPTADELSEDFDAVDLLIDEKETLESEVEELSDSLAEYRKTEYEQKVDDLVDLTDKWEKDELMEKFDADEDAWTIDDVEDRIELVEDLKSSEATTITDSGEDGGDGLDTDIETTNQGRFDLRERTKITAER